MQQQTLSTIKDILKGQWAKLALITFLTCVISITAQALVENVLEIFVEKIEDSKFVSWLDSFIGACISTYFTIGLYTIFQKVYDAQPFQFTDIFSAFKKPICLKQVSIWVAIITLITFAPIFRLEVLISEYEEAYSLVTYVFSEEVDALIGIALSVLGVLITAFIIFFPLQLWIPIYISADKSVLSKKGGLIFNEVFSSGFVSATIVLKRLKQFFLLYIRLLGWILLVIITFGLAAMWLVPLLGMSLIHMYRTESAHAGVHTSDIARDNTEHNTSPDSKEDAKKGTSNNTDTKEDTNNTGNDTGNNSDTEPSDKS